MNLYCEFMSLSTLFLSFRKALTAAAHVVHGEAERLVEEKVLDLSQVSIFILLVQQNTARMTL